ncbi:MAG: cytochrome c oxidase assembly protein [Acidobacteriota bacterium]|nr:cytochrome c oxidase assembly protein [Acidobacteriota bacterium]MDE3043763.1 cytochrome c oxidase assembly protein [Acidobacteriota bacterium]MDE3107218.1 cytochrome c oxidase assembly protein [Acidobacteriota bacterium]MDE3221911.1 cytochrome c oxidase assembly protein [Acidobacteriota bacterium]
MQSKRSGEWVRPLRSALAIVGALLLVAFCMPPLSTWARRYEFVEATQFCVFAFWTPFLIMIAAPWDRLGMTSHETYAVTEDGERVSPVKLRWLDRCQLRRTSRGGQSRAILGGVLFACLTIFWRMAPLVDGLVHHPWFVALEAASLVGLGVILFSDLVESPPLRPRAPRPVRIGIAAVIMWSVWVVAYLYGMSHPSWYQAFHHFAGRGISESADQQLSAVVVWATSAAIFIPIVFWNLARWFQSEEDPSDELYRLVREERTRGFFGTREY